MKYIELYLQELKILHLDMSPWLLLGFLIAGLLHVYLPERKMTRLLGSGNARSVIRAAILGVPLPLCSCGVIPAGVSLYRNGASKGASVSFLISTPQTGVDSILVTYSLLGLPFALLRPVIAFITGIAGGILTNLSEKNNKSPFPAHATVQEQGIPSGSRMVRFIRFAFYEFMADIAKWLVLGLLIAALISVAVPDDFFAGYLNHNTIDLFIILLLSLPMYICATSSVPIAAVLFMKGLSPGAVLVFLMAGPASNAATIAVIRKVFGKRTFLVYFLTLVIFSLAFGAIFNHLIPYQWFEQYLILPHSAHAHDLLPIWLKWSSAVLLAVLVAHVLFRKHLLKWIQPMIHKKMNPKQIESMDQMKIKVTGMTCSHCKLNVEMNLKKLQGVEQALADIDSGEVTIRGGSVDLGQVEKTIEEIGYGFGGRIQNR